jgi:methylated-DNA-[protein]-cysteine S-methyltransferase
MSFNEKVWNACRKVPKGRVTTYKIIAEALRTKACRAVGNALNKNPFAPKVPCHRVVKSDGSLGGYAKGASKKKQLLESEGIVVKNGRIDCFDEVLLKKIF